jgi:flagellar motor switch protein FliM
VETSVRFNETTMPSARLVELAPGQVLRLDHQVDHPLTLYVGEVPYLSVLAGRRGNQKAFAVVGTPGKKGADL